jgi:hypothetical protein
LRHNPGVPWQEFVISLLRTLISWPVVVFAGLLLFRHPLKKVVARLTRFEGFGVTTEFGEGLERAEEEVSELQAPDGEVPTRGDGSRAQPDATDLLLAKASPGGAVVTAWIGIEKKLERVVREHLDDPRRRPHATVTTRDLDQLAKANVIPVELSRSLHEMKLLRNMAAHGHSEPSTVEAIAYQQLAREVTSVLDGISVGSSPPRSDPVAGT